MTAIVSNTELQTISDWLKAGFLNDFCAIQRETGSGWVTVVGSEAVPCAVVGAAYTSAMPNELLGADLKTVLFPRNTDVKSPDRLVINGFTYRVFDVREPSTYEVLRRVTAVRFPIRGGA